MAFTSPFEQLLSDYDEKVQEWARNARALIRSIQPEAREEVETSWGGYLLFKQPVDGGNTVCFLSVHKKHVSVGFSQGAELEDPAGLLEGSGKLQRHLKIRGESDLKRPELQEFIRQAWRCQPEAAILKDALERIRKLCLAQPRSSETVSHGHPTFKVGKKSFAVYGIYSPSIAFKADVSLHAELEGDERFFPTPYMAHQGWLSMRLDGNTDWNVVKRMLEHSYALMHAS